MNFEELFAQYPCPFTDEQVKAQTAEIIAKHFAENNNVEVWKECLHQIDLTTLSADDTIAKVEGMAKAVNNFEKDFPGIPNVAAICVYPAMVEYVRKALKDPNFNIACVTGVFPSSQSFLEVKVAETALALKAGATEIDIVLSVGKFLEGRLQECFDEISELKAVCGTRHLKVILETGLLKSAENIWKASILAMAAGGDFIKTSTGKISVNATPEATFIMCHAIKAWQEKTGEKKCYKPAGGVSTTDEAVQHFTLVKEILGNEWLNNESFRFGASRLANNLLSSIVGKETKYF
ncbi:MAG: deoxyribose-phosphate aldolase [Paludibacteraceae bacterium]|nr:deoxyribose-phosphate aldolase [Paludibacteraceae bacterium]MBR6034674.1 deoxyribose-phosphate aldolase [Paludibacteraceae bacterium]